MQAPIALPLNLIIPSTLRAQLSVRRPIDKQRGRTVPFIPNLVKSFWSRPLYPSRKETPVPTAQKAGWTPKPVRTLSRQEQWLVQIKKLHGEGYSKQKQPELTFSFLC